MENLNYPPDQSTAKSSFWFLNYVHTNSLKLTHLLIFSKVILQFNISFYICCICKPFKIKFLLKFFETLFQINKQLNYRFFFLQINQFFNTVIKNFLFLFYLNCFLVTSLAVDIIAAYFPQMLIVYGWGGSLHKPPQFFYCRNFV